MNPVKLSPTCAGDLLPPERGSKVKKPGRFWLGFFNAVAQALEKQPFNMLAQGRVAGVPAKRPSGAAG